MTRPAPRAPRTIAAALALPLLLATACGEDVVLGQAPRFGPDATEAPDAISFDAAPVGPDAASAAFWPGPYDLVFGPERDVFCERTLSGMESAFADVTAASVAFVDGEIALVVLGANTIRLDGPAMLTGFGSEALVLQRGLADVPPELFVASAPRGRAPGPIDTTLTSVLFLLDVTTASGRGVEGSAYASFEAAGSAGVCTVGLRAHLTPLSSP